MRVVGLLASPRGSGATAGALAAVLDGCAAQGASTTVLDLAMTDGTVLAENVAAADAVVFASPTYRSTYTSLMGGALERLGRGLMEDEPAPLLGKAGAVLMTGAAPQHLLATERLQQVLSSFFALTLVSPPLYVTQSDPAAERCARHGRALVELATACCGAQHLGQLPPLV